MEDATRASERDSDSYECEVRSDRRMLAPTPERALRSCTLWPLLPPRPLRAVICPGSHRSRGRSDLGAGGHAAPPIWFIETISRKSPKA